MCMVARYSYTYPYRLGGWDSKSFVIFDFWFLFRVLRSCAGYHLHLWTSSPLASWGLIPAAPALPHMSLHLPPHSSASRVLQAGAFTSLSSPHSQVHGNLGVSVTAITLLNQHKVPHLISKQAGCRRRCMLAGRGSFRSGGTKPWIRGHITTFHVIVTIFL